MSTTLEVASPVGPLGVATTDVGVVAVTFGGAAGLPDVVAPDGAAWAEQAVVELAEYFAGTRQVFTVPIDWRLSAGFNRQVREVLFGTVGYGEVIGYGELASRVLARPAADRSPGRPGDPYAARAVGQAMASNPVPVIVPCHRVVAADGSLHGFGGGLEAKRRLLAREGAAPMTLDDLLEWG
jgi:methylated-DNA-[protein]-cysteine S-methyltransferase